MFVTPDTALVEDCIQSLFVRLWEKRQTLGTARHVRSYLLSSFKRSLVTALRQQQKHAFVELDKVESAGLYREDSIEELLIRNQERSSRLEQLSQALQQLPPRQREFIFLRYYKGLSYEAIAAQTGSSVRTVYNQVNLAISTLRKEKKLRFDNGDLFLVILSSFSAIENL